MFKTKPNVARLKLAVSRELQRHGVHCEKCHSCIDSQHIPLNLTTKEQTQKVTNEVLTKMLQSYDYAFDNVKKKLCSYHTKLGNVKLNPDMFLPDGVDIKLKRDYTHHLIDKYYNGICSTCKRQPSSVFPYLGFYFNHKISKYDENRRTEDASKKKYNIAYFFIDFGSIYGTQTSAINRTCLDMPFIKARNLIYTEVLKCDYQCSPCHHLITMQQKTTFGSHSLDWTEMKQQIYAEIAK
jgi:hypothetical protein